MKKSISFLKKKAKKIRKEILSMAFATHGAHISSSLGIVEMLVTLYWSVMNSNPKLPTQKNRDRFILSKGHAVSALYAVLAEKGFLSKKLLKTYGKDGSSLLGHPEYGTPGIEFSTGSLGHGLSVATGMALAAKLDNKKYSVYTLLSDAECEEGTVWETALFASHHSLNNLCVLIDYNKLQAFGKTNEIINLEPLGDKWKSFGWHVIEIDGHDFSQLLFAFSSAAKSMIPTCIICHTIAGKGVSFIEDKVEWHYRNLTKEEYDKAVIAIDTQ